MAIRIGDILKLPDAIHNELEARSRMRARSMANNIVDGLFGKHAKQDRPQPEKSLPPETEPRQTHVAGKARGGDWGGGGW